MTPEEIEWAEAAKAGRAKTMSRGLRRLAVVLISGAVAIGAGAVGLRWAEARRADRIARYERGELVVVSRQEGVYGYGPDYYVAPLGLGLVAGAVVMALGMTLVTRDKTYLRGLRV